MLARQCLTRVSRRGFCAAAVADHSKLDDEIAKIAARAAGTTGLSSPRDSRKVVGIADAKGGVAASGDSVGPQWGTVSEFVRDDAGLRGRFHTALQQVRILAGSGSAGCGIRGGLSVTLVACISVVCGSPRSSG